MLEKSTRCTYLFVLLTSLSIVQRVDEKGENCKWESGGLVWRKVRKGVVIVLPCTLLMVSRRSNWRTTTTSNKIDRPRRGVTAAKKATMRTASKQRNATAKEAHGAYQQLFWQSGGRQKMLPSPGYRHWCLFGNAHNDSHLVWCALFIHFDWDAVHNASEVLCSTIQLYNLKENKQMQSQKRVAT